MNFSQMPSQITTLRKVFITIITHERPIPSMFPEVISQITGFLKHASTIFIIAFEKQVVSRCFRILNFDYLMPMFGSVFKGFAFTWVRDDFFGFVVVLGVFGVIFRMLRSFALSLSWCTERSSCVTPRNLLIPDFLDIFIFIFIILR